MGLIKMFRRGDRVGVEERARVLMDTGGEAAISDVLNGEMLSDAVTMKEAMSLPGVWCAINFLSSAMAGFPIDVFEVVEGDGGDKKIQGGVADVLGAAINDTTTSYSWRETFFAQVFGPGRAYSYLERNRLGEVINIFPMEYERVTVRKEGHKVWYDHAEAGGRIKTYPAKDVIDLAFLLKPNFVQCYNPIQTCAAAIKQGLNANRYALTVFGKNGIPPYLLKGPFQAGKEMIRAAADLMKITRRSAEEGKPILPIPGGHDLVRLGDDPEKMQLTPVQIFAVGQVARIYQMPPVFLQELSKGNYNNMEHQDLHLVKHTLRRWVKKFEQELTLKIFGRNSSRYVKLNLDGIMRGDLKTRIEAIARAVQTGLLTPNEGRQLDNRPPKSGGDVLLVQGAMVPIEMAGKAFSKNMPSLDEAEPKEPKPE
ncbi:phage portal protein [Sulfitobacter pacificus]|uniref:Phage portal protein n=1 Tax=Sulfitobacter pacificus TaxID=1499314 RepID=A0ABQ5VGC1_9RHOB|nr:phage portal protein [Sulfitobacter pacificus]GLQ26126.1 hypothetical protein GCM10007927_09290 [Sulfitobacter pacificus]